MRIKVDLDHMDIGRGVDFGRRIVSSENSDIERVCGDQALQKGTTEATGLRGGEKVRGGKSKIRK